MFTVCELDLLCMKLIAYREKDKFDIDNLIARGISQGVISETVIMNRLNYLYGIDYKLKNTCIKYIRSLKLPK